MESIGLFDAKTHLSELVARAERGEEVVITRHNKPVAKLVPYVESVEPRVGGQWKGKIWLADDWDAPMTEEELKEWYDAPIFPEGTT